MCAGDARKVTCGGRVDPASRVRKIIDLDLWEISIITFPLLSGARVRAVKGSVSSPPKPSYARARAEREWERVRGGVVLPAAPVRYKGAEVAIGRQ